MLQAIYAACRLVESLRNGDSHTSGPAGLRLIRGFNDEPLRGEWKGHRSSRLGEQYRVIYKVENKRLLVMVIDLMAHDYQRK